MRIFISLTLLLAGLPLNGKIRVVTTTTMITDLVQDIGGDKIHLTGMMNPGVDPHLYKAKPSDSPSKTCSAPR